MGNVDFKKVIIAGIAGTAAMTALMLMAPMMGVPKMDMGEMLGTMNPMMPMPYMMGWVMHFIIGIALTWFYAAFLIDRLPSDGWKRGMIYSLIPWAVMNFMAMPMMGMGIFSGGMMAIVGTVLVHFAYGGVMGAIYTGEASSDASTDTSTDATPAAEPTEAPAAAPVSEPEPTPEPTPDPEPAPEPEPTPAPEPEAPAEEESNPEPAPEAGGDSEGEEESEEGDEDDSSSDEKESGDKEEKSE